MAASGGVLPFGGHTLVGRLSLERAQCVPRRGRFAVLARVCSAGVAVGVLVDPAQAADVESVAGAGDGDVGEAGFGVVDVSGQGVTVLVRLFLVHRFGEALADADGGPFAALGLVGGGDHDLSALFDGEIVYRVEDDVDAVFVDKIDQGQQVTARREGLRPHEIGLPTSMSRRIPGLRREEVAELAHMSVDYYTRLEQARGPRPSPRILDSLAQALRLTPAERSHLFRLAGSSAPPGTNAVRRVRPQVARMLRRLPETGAIVTDAAYGVVAWNPLAQALLGDDLGRGTTNLAQRRFLSPRRMYESSSAEEFGHIVVARLRRAADRYPHDAQLAALLTELRTGSEEFRQIWETRPVHAPGHRGFRPAAGPATVTMTVKDAGTRPPHTRPGAPGEPGGLGWPLVQQLSLDVQVRVHPGGKTVTAVIPLAL